MVNYKGIKSEGLIRVINLGENLMKKIIKRADIYILRKFLADDIFMYQLITSSKEAIKINKEIKNNLNNIYSDTHTSLGQVGLTGDSLDIKVTHIDIWDKLYNKSKTKLALRHLFDGIILVLESLAKVFSKLEFFVEMLKLLKNISKIYDDPYLPSYP